VGSPPIALSRIIKYTGDTVRYWYKDHRTNKKEEIEVPVLKFIGRMAQHILPWGFKQVRYYGLHATCKAAKVREIIKDILSKLGRVMEEVKREIKHYSYRQGIIKMTGKDPLCCMKCGTEMWLWLIYHPKYGIIYEGSKELEAVTNVQEERGARVAGGIGRIRTGNVGNRGRDVLQLSLFTV
jgi:hypothetical protein